MYVRLKQIEQLSRPFYCQSLSEANDLFEYATYYCENAFNVLSR